MSGGFVQVDGGFDAWLSYPAAAEPRPAVVVLQEIFGVNRFVREACDWLAANGFLAIAPDLFWRQEPRVDLDESERERAMALMGGLDETQTIADCVAAIGHVRALPECSGKIGALGYCLGGKLAYLLAARSPVDAAVAYYGVGIHGALDEADAVRVPLLLHIASEDALCPPAAQEQIVSAFRGNPHVRIESYRAGHAFARTGSAAYSEAHATRANRLSLAFLSEHL